MAPILRKTVKSLSSLWSVNWSMLCPRRSRGLKILKRTSDANH